MPPPYTLYVNEERTVKVEDWPDEVGRIHVAVRAHPDDMWGPPIPCDEEDMSAYYPDK